MIAALFSSFYISGSDVLEHSDRTNCSLWLQLDYYAAERKHKDSQLWKYTGEADAASNACLYMMVQPS